MGKRTNRTALYTHLMRWEPLEIRGSEGRAWIKTLAKDEENGARTALIKFDPGYKQAKTVGTWPVDMYVLEGEMECGGVRYEKDTYHYRPAGTKFGPIHCPKGITRLLYTADSKTKSSREEVFVQDVKQYPSKPSYMDPTGKRSVIKVLRQDTEANISVLVHAHFFIGPAGVRGLASVGSIHDHIEEVFVLEGESQDYLGDIDGHISWVPGFYVCREPYGSLHGDSSRLRFPFVTFIRRGWVGEMANFHQPEVSNTKELPTTVDFTE